MDGRTLRAGTVSSVKYVQHPISLARAVLEHSLHVALTGEGAPELALECGLPLAAPSYFQTQKTRRQWLDLAQQESGKLAGHDTVGAVALDQAGNLAVAASTGGTYATNEACAVSCTGDGEVILRGALAHEVYALVKYKGRGLPGG